MNFRKIMAGVGEDLNPIKKGRKKTQAMVCGYSMTMVAFLFLTIAGLVVSDDRFMSFTLLMSTLLAEGLFGAYSFLSLRIRRLEETAESVPVPKKR